ncbi:MAG: hypothetical protein KAJ65_04545 [Gammaproteobacteria bacterium]|jgi:hypothetical protein|nr:hypothetical protein [Gammaproteobacteria bacterium]
MSAVLRVTCLAWVVQPVTLMMHLSCIKPCWQPFRLLLVSCVSCVFLTGAGTHSGSGDSRDRFVKLDSEIQAIKEEILDINQEILLIEELSLYPHGQQMIVLVSVATNSLLRPDSISLQLDGQTVSEHHYSDNEYAAMQAGGVHRLYTGRVDDGEHQLVISVTGEQARGNAFSQQRSVTITKQAGRKYMELHLGPREDTAEPGLTIREW